MTYRGTGLTTTTSLNILDGDTAVGSVADPRTDGTGSAAVQVQNKLPIKCNLTVGGDAWSVSGMQSATIPLPAGASGVLYSMPNSSGAQQSGALVFVWMLDAQQAPQPDGPLTGPS